MDDGDGSDDVFYLFIKNSCHQVKSEGVCKGFWVIPVVLDIRVLVGNNG